MIATVSTGAMLFGLVSATDSGLSLGHCLLFAALISPTDPVATLSTLREVRAPPVLRHCIFGEATLNDALSIVIFNVVRKHFHSMGSDGFGQTAWSILSDLCECMVGSIATGAVFGLGAAYMTRSLAELRLGRAGGGTGTASHHHHEDVPHAELALLFTFAILTFAASESLGFSGIASLFVCGVLTRHYTVHNLSAEARSISTTLFLTLATLSETGLSTLLGVAMFDYSTRLGLWDFSLALLTLPVLFVARALNIFPLTLLANALRRGRKHSISLPMAVVMWFSGMRGALSFALAVTLDSSNVQHDAEGDAEPPNALPRQVFHQLVAATLVTIAASMLLMAPATRPLICLLRIAPPAHEPWSGGGNELATALLQQPSTLAAMVPTPSTSTLPTPQMRRFNVSPPSATRSRAPSPFEPPTPVLSADPAGPSPPTRARPPTPTCHGEPPAAMAHADQPATPHLASAGGEGGGSTATGAGAEQPGSVGDPGPGSWYRVLRQFEASYLKPIFGGRHQRDRAATAIVPPFAPVASHGSLLQQFRECD
jgi:NhaP-type Na+/H+ or K+/H+ antiporter